MNKIALREAIVQRLQAELAQQTAAAELARDEAISEESRPENKYDTHSQEAAYLAEGQARLANEISQSIAQYVSLPVPSFSADTPVALGAVVGIDTGVGTAWYFIGPRAGGLEVTLDDRAFLVITPQSPLGRELVGKRAGEPVKLPGRATGVKITAVE